MIMHSKPGSSIRYSHGCIRIQRELTPEELKAILRKWSPEMAVLVKTPANAKLLAAAAPFTASMELKNAKPTYYICTDGACALPVNL